MRYKNMTYRKIAMILKVIGFKEKKMKATHIIFSHPKSNVIILLPYYSPKTIISPPQLSMITRTIIEKGILSEDALYEILQAGEEKVVLPNNEAVFA